MVVCQAEKFAQEASPPQHTATQKMSIHSMNSFDKFIEVLDACKWVTSMTLSRKIREK